LSEELCRPERNRSPCLQRREAGPLGDRVRAQPRRGVSQQPTNARSRTKSDRPLSRP